MSTKIKLFYKLSDKGSRSFIKMIPSNVTCEELLQIINKSNDTTYSIIYFNDKKIDSSDLIIKYWETDPKYIFNISTINFPPRPIYKSDTFSIEFMFTGGTSKHLYDGIYVQVNDQMGPDQLNSYLMDILKGEKIDLEQKQLLIYLPGGIPFNEGYLGDIWVAEYDTFHSIFGVLTNSVSESLLNSKITEFCDVSSEELKSLFSPLVKSSDRGIASIACLLGYLSHGGINENLMVNAFDAYFHFPPLFLSICKIIDKCEITGRDIINICSTLYTYLRLLLPSSCSNEQVFENSFHIFNLMLIQLKKNVSFDVFKIKIDPDDISTRFISDLNLSSPVYFYGVKRYNHYNDKGMVWSPETLYFDDNKDQLIYINIFDPLNQLISRGSRIIKAENHDYLLLEDKSIIDPLTGKNEEKKIDDFLKEHKLAKNYGIEKVIYNYIEEVTIIVFDESYLMLNNHNKTDSRFMYAIQILSLFANKLTQYQINSFLALVTFGFKCSLRCPFTSNVTEIEKACPESIDSKNVAKTAYLWDSLLFCCETFDNYKEIYKFFESKKLRIIVISSGVDVGSSARPENVIKELLKRKIVVDSIIINDDSEKSKLLCAVSLATFGCSFKLDDFTFIQNIVESIPFLQISKRHYTVPAPFIPGERKTIPTRLKPEDYDSDFIDKIQKNVQFSTQLIYDELFWTGLRSYCLTYNYIVKKNEKLFHGIRFRMVMIEFKLANQVSDPNSSFFDPDLKFFATHNRYDYWIVLLKGPEGTPYEKKWWKLSIEFQEHYPYQPPIVCFQLPPYHLNISADGRICLDILENDYKSSIHVLQIVQALKELLITPNEERPVRLDILDTYRTNKELYWRLAKESAEKNAKDDFNEYIGKIIE